MLFPLNNLNYKINQMLLSNPLQQMSMKYWESMQKNNLIKKNRTTKKATYLNHLEQWINNKNNQSLQLKNN